MADFRKPAPDGAEADEKHNGIDAGAEPLEPVVEALHRKIATLQDQQKDAIQRLSIQRVSIQDVGLELARLEDELATAKGLLQRRLSRDRSGSTAHETAAAAGHQDTIVE